MTKFTTNKKIKKNKKKKNKAKAKPESLACARQM